MKIQWECPTIQQMIVSSLFTLISYPFFFLCPPLWGHGLWATVPAGLTGAYAARLYQRYLSLLQGRIDAGNNGVMWDVVLNDVTVGSISDSEYAAIRSHVFQDIRIWGRQFANVGRMALRVMDLFFLVVPLWIFWGGVLFAITSPDSFREFVIEAQHAGVDGIATMARATIQLFVLGAVVTVMVNLLLGNRLGFINRFSEATNSAVRKHCGVAAEGDMRLVRYDNDTVYINDEMDFVRRK